MKVLALNSSPRAGAESRTGMLLEPLLAGLAAGGAEVQAHDLKDLKVRHCLGCFTCWTKTPGQCVIPDDMTKALFPAWSQADLVVYGTPLYHFTVNARLKAFIERTLPFVEPFMEREGGVTRHPVRFRPPQVVLVSPAGFPHASVFDQLRDYARFLFGPGLVAELYRPGAESLDTPALAAVKADIADALRRAGEELAAGGRVAEETLARITQPAGDEDALAGTANLFWRACREAGATPRELAREGLGIRPRDLEEFLLLMSQGLNPLKAGGLRAVVQFEFSGQAEGVCHLAIDQGRAAGGLGPAPEPDLTVRAPFELWLDIQEGRADGQEAFISGRARAEGDLGLLLRLPQVFGA
jgi:NAD(P)H-dependent FMN reductase